MICHLYLLAPCVSHILYIKKGKRGFEHDCPKQPCSDWKTPIEIISLITYSTNVIPIPTIIKTLLYCILHPMRELTYKLKSLFMIVSS